MTMHEEMAEVLFTKEDIEKIVDRLGKQITEDYKDKNLMIIGVLKGSVVFMADIMRKIDLKCKIDFMAISSYGSGTTSGKLRVLKDLQEDISGYDVLIIEDILDSGKTLSHLTEMLRLRGPKSMKICAFFDKPNRREANIAADYVGAVIPDKFIVGYGLDFAEHYRNLDYVGVLKPEMYE